MNKNNLQSTLYVNIPENNIYDKYAFGNKEGLEHNYSSSYEIRYLDGSYISSASIDPLALGRNVYYNGNGSAKFYAIENRPVTVISEVNKPTEYLWVSNNLNHVDYYD